MTGDAAWPPPAEPARSLSASARRASRRSLTVVGLGLLAWFALSGTRAAFPVVDLAYLPVLSVADPRWWRYVRTGRRAEPGWLAGHPAGTWRVLLDDAGPHPGEVVRQVREATAAPRQQAEQLVRTAPSVIARWLAEESARELVRRLDAAGALAHTEPA